MIRITILYLPPDPPEVLELHKCFLIPKTLRMVQ